MLLCLSQIVWAEGVPSGCHYTGHTCIQAGGTKVIDGVSVTSSCWQYQQHYTCGLAPVDGCTAYEKKCRPGAVQECLFSIGGQCVDYRYHYECPTKVCDGHSLYCGNNIFCIDGHCAKQTPKDNKHFGQDVSELAAVAKGAADAVKQKNAGQGINLFAGHARHCKRIMAGIINCCKDSGWGKDIGLAKCSDDDKKLGEDKQHYLATYVGEYSKHVLGVKVYTVKVYCVYDSKLARIIGDYGRAQLGEGYGDPRHPHCGGFSITDFQRLNFSAMDFVDPIYIYPYGSHNQAAGIAADMKVHAPSANAIANSIDDRIKKDLKHHTPSSAALPNNTQNLANAIAYQARGQK